MFSIEMSKMEKISVQNYTITLIIHSGVQLPSKILMAVAPTNSFPSESVQASTTT